MYISRSILLALACTLGITAGPAFAHSDDGSYGSMPMMGSGGGMMGFGSGGMMGPGTGAMMNAPSTAQPQALGDENLDRIGDRLAERYQLMQRIASESDEKARRDLVREYLQQMHGYASGGDDDADGDTACGGHWRRGWGHGPGGYGTMGPGMMGYGPMGYGMMGYGMMGPGMMGYGPMGYGMMGPGMMGYGPMAYGRMPYRGMGRAMMRPGRLSDKQLDRMADHMAESYKDMQEIAQTTDKAKRRELLREHFKDMTEFWQNQ